MAKDFLAIALIGAGSSFGRATTQEEAVTLCKKQIESDWSSLYDINNKLCSVNVYDVTGHDKLYWDHRGVHTDSEPEVTIPRLDLVKVLLTVKKRRKR
jgi:hypothetical protein